MTVKPIGLSIHAWPRAAHQPQPRKREQLFPGMEARSGQLRWIGATATVRDACKCGYAPANCACEPAIVLWAASVTGKVAAATPQPAPRDAVTCESCGRLGTRATISASHFAATCDDEDACKARRERAVVNGWADVQRELLRRAGR